MIDNAVISNASTYDYHMVNAENAQNTSRERQIKGMSSDMRTISRRDWITVGVLCFVNLINYMDRFTVAGTYYFILKSYKLYLCVKIVQ